MSRSKPPANCITFNVDGAASGNPGVVGAGGLIRNELGVFLGVFCTNLGITTNVSAELWGILCRLEFAWAEGCRKVEVAWLKRLQMTMYR